jgi:hypothetical protein
MHLLLQKRGHIKNASLGSTRAQFGEGCLQWRPTAIRDEARGRGMCEAREVKREGAWGNMIRRCGHLDAARTFHKQPSRAVVVRWRVAVTYWRPQPTTNAQHPSPRTHLYQGSLLPGMESDIMDTEKVQRPEQRMRPKVAGVEVRAAGEGEVEGRPWSGCLRPSNVQP